MFRFASLVAVGVLLLGCSGHPPDAPAPPASVTPAAGAAAV